MKYLLTPVNAGITGFESPAAEYTQSALSLDEYLVDHPSATYFGRADGDSMVEAGIFSGDLLIVSRAVKAEQGDIIVATLNGEFVCKIWDAGQRRLVSAAKDIPHYHLTEGDDFIIEGVVIRSIRMHRPASKVF